MGNNWFDFKQFRIVQEKSAFRVGTDGVLLGAWASFEKRKQIVDAGTGTGLIALMAAQRSGAIIRAIEPDQSSAEEARINVKASPWSGRIVVKNISLQELAESSEPVYDMIVSNPPFFTDSLPNRDQRLSAARHNITLSQNDLLESADRLLAPGGVLSLILPWEEGNVFIASASGYGFYCNRLTRVKPLPSLPAHRIMMEFSRVQVPLQSDWLIISSGERNHFTAEYRALTKDFYLQF
ncbi:MAG: methyltransferase [Bacteroidales bacterium]|nr:methyltransferase [Bacteroidales bacterium]